MKLESEPAEGCQQGKIGMLIMFNTCRSNEECIFLEVGDIENAECHGNQALSFPSSQIVPKLTSSVSIIGSHSLSEAFMVLSRSKQAPMIGHYWENV